VKRRLFLQTILAGALSAHFGASAAEPVIEVYKSESCGCCGAWLKHLQENGFTVKARNVEDPGQYRAKFGMPSEYGSCHSARVQGYAIEGHVPASEIKRLLTEKPRAIGLAVSGMPMGSPGMEGPRQDAYEVLLVQAKGQHTVYQQYGAK
jgi:hypothetical protein